MPGFGYIHCGSETCYVRVYYDATFVPGAGQSYTDAPLINNTNSALGTTGFCLTVVNTSGASAVASVYDKNGALIIDHVTVPTGNPVTSGQARSRTAAQLASFGLTKRGDVGSVMFE